MQVKAIADFLNDILKINDFAPDPSNNGLQVCGDEMRECNKIAFAVDASLASIEQAVQNKADLLVVHHGLSWGGGIRRWQGTTGKRFAEMFKNDLALYAMHLPLDAHEIYGNNAVLADLMQLENRRMFFAYHGMQIGIMGETAPKSAGEIAQMAAAGKDFALYRSPLKNDEVKCIAVISGGGGLDGLECAIECGADMLVTGEFDHTMYHVVQENPIHVAALGHYNSEVHGVQSLQKLLQSKFALETVFLDIPTGL